MTDPNGGEVLPLGIDPPEPPSVAPRGSRLHSAAVAITALAATAAIACTLLFITVGWSGRPRRVVIAALMASVVTFLAGVAATVLTAARDTYARPRDG